MAIATEHPNNNEGKKIHSGIHSMKHLIEKIKNMLIGKSGIEGADNLNENANLTIELAKALIKEIQTTYPTWKKAFLRLEATDDSIECRASCELPNQVDILDVLKHKALTRAAMDIGDQLHAQTLNNGKKFLVLLLIVDSNLNFEAEYEYENSNRWTITKLNGNSGIPTGYTKA